MTILMKFILVSINALNEKNIKGCIQFNITDHLSLEETFQCFAQTLDCVFFGFQIPCNTGAMCLQSSGNKEGRLHRRGNDLDYHW